MQVVIAIYVMRNLNALCDETDFLVPTLTVKVQFFTPQFFRHTKMSVCGCVNERIRYTDWIRFNVKQIGFDST